MTGRFSLKALLGFMTCVAILIVIDWFLLAVTVRIHNTGKVAMNDVQIHVSGKTYAIGTSRDLPLRVVALTPATNRMWRFPMNSGRSSNRHMLIAT